MILQFMSEKFLFLPPQLLLLNMMSYGVGYRLGQSSSSALAMSAPRLLPMPSLLAFGEAGLEIILNSLDAVPVLLSNSQNIGETSPAFYVQVQSTAVCRLLWGQPTPFQPDPVQHMFSVSKTLIHLIDGRFFFSDIQCLLCNHKIIPLRNTNGF